MLTIYTGTGGGRTCDGMARRDFLRVGSLALGGLTLPGLLGARAAASGTNANFVRDRSVVLLYLSGGASHIETFDPKMDMPEGTRSVTGEVETSLPGVTFGGTFPLLARWAHRMAVVHSFQHPVVDHVLAHVHVLSGGTDPVGKQQTGFSMGSAYTRLRGANHPVTGMPTYAALVEKEIDGQYANERGRLLAGSWPGSLGPSFAPLQHETGWQDEATGDRATGDGATEAAAPKSGRQDLVAENPLAASMRLNLPRGVLDDRWELLRRMDGLSRAADANMRAVDAFSQQAIDLIVGGAFRAFDFRHEDPKLVERYDTFHIPIGHKVFRPSTLGRQMLVARRLCEAGCGFVTVHSAGWDMHADRNNPGMVSGMEMLGRSLDRAVSAFLEDVESRGLNDKILLVITGDFGRTPRINKNGGRDHWSKLCTLAFAGGGLQMGQVIGRSAREADVPASEPISTPELMATVMHALFDVGQLRLVSGLPRELTQLVDTGRPIRELFS
jgi:hypothetical protein